MLMAKQIGVTGLTVMVENLVLNPADHGASVAGYDRTAERPRRFFGEPAAGDVMSRKALPIRQEMWM
jgi:6-phosphogluconate dehydrogenase